MVQKLVRKKLPYSDEEYEPTGETLVTESRSPENSLSRVSGNFVRRSASELTEYSGEGGSALPSEAEDESEEEEVQHACTARLHNSPVSLLAHTQLTARRKNSLDPRRESESARPVQVRAQA